MSNLLRRLPAYAALAALLAAGALAAAPAMAANQANEMGGIGASNTVTTRATVQAIDTATRTVTLVGPAGNKVALVAGPEVVNFDRIKVGDTVIAKFRESVVFVLSGPNAKIPDNSLTVAGGTAAKGAMPAGAAGARIVVTGLVVGIDPSAHTLQIVDPTGGGVRTVHVRSDRGRKNFNAISVGDTITAVVSQAVAVAIEPVK